MKTRRFVTKVLLISAFILIANACQHPPKDIELALKSIPNVVEVKEIEADTFFLKTYEIWIEQPLDHKVENGERFKQKVLLSHKGFDRPVVAELHGYAIYSKNAGELTKLLGANQLNVEHRFFKESRPDSIPWDKLTIWQAATDQHEVIRAIKKAVYKNNKWLSTGISKGGQTTIFHRFFYPKDVDVSVPYVAPLNFQREEPRVYDFLKKVGTEEERNRIAEFQLACFEHREELIQHLKKLAEEKNYQWKLPVEEIINYYILEYSFAFWQWGNIKIDDIPESNACSERLFNHLIKVTGIGFFEEKGVAYNLPYFWASLTEIGGYAYETAPFKAFFPERDVLDFEWIAPEGTDPVYDTSIMPSIDKWLKAHGSNFIYIYGEKDSWSASAVDPGTKTNALKMVLKDGHHGTRIKHFSDEDREKIYLRLEEWMGVEIEREN